MAEDRSIAPTPRRREAAHREGRFPRSRELAAGVVLLSALALLSVRGANWFTDASAALKQCLSSPALIDVDTDDFHEYGRRFLSNCCIKLVPILGFSLLSIFGVQLVQGGFVWLPDRLAWSPLRIFGQGSRPPVVQQTIRSSLGSFAFLLALVILIAILWNDRETLFGSSAASLPVGLASVAVVLSVVVGVVTAVMLLVAAVEYSLRLWSYHNSLKMTVNEARDELKGRESMHITPAGTGSERAARQQIMPHHKPVDAGSSEDR